MLFSDDEKWKVTGTDETGICHLYLSSSRQRVDIDGKSWWVVPKGPVAPLERYDLL